MPASALHRQLMSWLLLPLFLLARLAWAQPMVDAASVSTQPLTLTSYVSVLEDPTGKLTLADVQSTELQNRFKADQPPGSSLAMGFTRSAFWLRLNLSNSSDMPLQRLLVLENPRVSHVQANIPQADGSYRAINTGSDVPQSSKVYPNRNFVFPLTLPAHSEQTLYLRVESSIGLLVPLQLWPVKAFHAYERDDYTGKAWYFGIAVAMILFNLMLLLALRDPIYLLYVVFVSCTAGALAIKNGLAPDWSLFGMPLNANVNYYSGVSLALAALLQFARRMMQFERILPRLDWVLRGMILLYLLSLIAYAVALPYVSRAGILLNFATAVILLAGAGVAAFKRQRSAFFFLAAFALLMLGGAMTSLRAMGIVPTNLFTVDGLQLGSAMEMLVLAFALADRFNVMRREKARVQEELIRTQQQLVDNLRSSEHELELRVAERTDELRELNNQLEAMSLTDALTGIANRRRFDQVLAQEWGHARRSGESLALAVVDVDWFKSYNDRYGHPAGDACLREIAQALATTVNRSTDLVARYGGEEFVFLAPMTDLAGVRGMAQKLLQAVEALALPHELSPLGRVSVSIGVAASVPGQEASAEVLVARADTALYEAKKQGRNQVMGG
ncbi:sensor domain-containing diguanylate cyclase [Pseudomonas nitroreducens]|uniref:sensor domain-containing diguanylate cyclase n=1 Tax=Pseudomonas nitroreducens TaxID=46680 RepID=UPI00265A6B04|nr:diguanylate cyclase [Pseudomonas nitroreducens]MCP1649102.1 diguanylate cyclase (GGDEF)-like protein [Pseudomonas nitroreducens]MCP1684937.1 diguanylate cyclase (GGDEF)-like protein [Pseudomonas nitroreducens]